MERVDPEVAARHFDTAARFIARQEGGPDRLLQEHSPDDEGKCLGCRRPGYGTAYVPWPCAVAKLAQTARRL